VKPGTILYEISGVPEDLAKQALLRVCHKMPLRCRFVTRRHGM
jgi:large subunit ribosomal protein L16